MIDAVVIFWALHEMKNPQAVLRETHRVLRPGGKLLVVEFPCNSLAQKLWNETYYTDKQLIYYFLKAGFKDVRAKQIEHKQILWINAYRGVNPVKNRNGRVIPLPTIKTLSRKVKKSDKVASFER